MMCNVSECVSKIVILKKHIVSLNTKLLNKNKDIIKITLKNVFSAYYGT